MNTVETIWFGVAVICGVYHGGKQGIDYGTRICPIIVTSAFWPVLLTIIILSKWSSNATISRN